LIVRAMVSKIKKGKGWSRIEVVDESGTGAMFHNEDTQIEVGQMYFFLVGNNRVVRYVTSDEIYEALELGTVDGFVKYLIEEEHYTTEDSFYVVAFDRRTTKAGKMMGTLVLADYNGDMDSVVVFSSNFAKAYSKAKPGTNIFAEFKQLKDGGICLGDIL
jgi:DNA polymerase III subunit alpha